MLKIQEFFASLMVFQCLKKVLGPVLQVLSIKINIICLCQPTGRNCTVRQGWRCVLEGVHTRKTVCPCLGPLFSQFAARTAPCGPCRMAAGAGREAPTSKTLPTSPSEQGVVGLNVSSVVHFLPCCCCTAENRHRGALYLRGT